MPVPNQDKTVLVGDDLDDQLVSNTHKSDELAKDLKLELTKLKYTAGQSNQFQVGSFQSTHSCDTLDTSGSSTDVDDEEADKSNGSEFGECMSSRELKNKLPQVEKEIAEMLKLKDASILKDKIGIINVTDGTILCKEGDYVSEIN